MDKWIAIGRETVRRRGGDVSDVTQQPGRENLAACRMISAPERPVVNISNGIDGFRSPNTPDLTAIPSWNYIEDNPGWNGYSGRFTRD